MPARWWRARCTGTSAVGPLITLLTDFGTADAYVGIMKGVILGICPQAQVVDLTHEVPPQNIRAGALLLRSAAPYFPRGTIHVAVVDPGVGGTRAPVLMRTARASFIGPDNGLLEPAARAFGIERVMSLSRGEYHLAQVSATFHGRDVFAPAAAHLAAGVAPDALGPPQTQWQSLALPAPTAAGSGVAGEVVYVDHFGNLVTNLTREHIDSFPARPLLVSIARFTEIPVAATYGDVESGRMVGVIGSWGHLEVAERGGNAAHSLGVGVGAVVHLRSV